MTLNNERPVARSIPKDYSTENSSKSGHTRYRRVRLFPKGLIVGTSYIESLIFDARFFKDIVITLKNPHASVSLSYVVEACIDPEHWKEVVGTEASPSTLTAGTDVALSTSPTGAGGLARFDRGYAYIKVLVKVSSGTGSVNGFIAGQK